VLDLGQGKFAFYEHLKSGSVVVRKGQHVKKGQTIAALGYTGQSTGPHLHFHVADSLRHLIRMGFLTYSMSSRRSALLRLRTHSREPNLGSLQRLVRSIGASCPRLSPWWPFPNVAPRYQQHYRSPPEQPSRTATETAMEGAHNMKTVRAEARIRGCLSARTAGGQALGPAPFSGMSYVGSREVRSFRIVGQSSEGCGVVAANFAGLTTRRLVVLSAIRSGPGHRPP
jgi:Peptidase family M23